MEQSRPLIRQGDLLFIPCLPTAPNDVLYYRKRQGGILREGEATGHHHQLAVAEDAEIYESIFRANDKPLYLKVGANGVSIVHEEHGTVRLPPDQTFAVHIAREYDYMAGLTRTVMD